MPSRRMLFQRSAPGAYAALDIGTEYAKALVFSVQDGSGTVLGVGRHRQSQSAMQDGLITDIAAVVQNCHEALAQAEQKAGVVARRVVVGMAGELVKGLSTAVTVERARPSDSLKLDEIGDVIEQVQRLALTRVTERLTWEMGQPQVDVRLVNTAVVSIKIDGHQISNPIGFQGRYLQVTVFNAFAPLVHVGASESIAHQLRLDLLSVVAEPYAVANCLSDTLALELGGIFIDVGGGTTDVALVRNGGIEATESFALGGRAFTRRLATEQSIDLDDAESLKIRYSKRELSPAAAKDVRRALDRDVSTWMDGIQLILEEMAGEGQLPPYVYLCGGASALPDIMERLKAFPWTERLPCPRPPQISLLRPEDVTSLRDSTGGLTDQQDITPMGLAIQAFSLQRNTSLINEALVRAGRMLKL